METGTRKNEAMRKGQRTIAVGRPERFCGLVGEMLQKRRTKNLEKAEKGNNPLPASDHGSSLRSSKHDRTDNDTWESIKDDDVRHVDCGKPESRRKRHTDSIRNSRSAAIGKKGRRGKKKGVVQRTSSSPSPMLNVLNTCTGRICYIVDQC
jgi:hypothetical protein